MNRSAPRFRSCDDRSMETPIPYTPCFYCVLKHRSGRIVDACRGPRRANSDSESHHSRTAVPAAAKVRWSVVVVRAHDDGGHASLTSYDLRKPSKRTSWASWASMHENSSLVAHAAAHASASQLQNNRPLYRLPWQDSFPPRHAAVTSSEHRRSSLFPLRMGHHHHHYSRALLQCTIPP
jgi:hypothetical protein